MPAPSTRYWTLVWLVVALGIVLRAEALVSGLHMDDYAQLAMVQGDYPVSRAPWDLFTFSAGAHETDLLASRGSLPWWSASQLRLSAFRPASSLLIWVDVRLLGARPVLAHMHSMLWFAAMLVSAGAALRLVLPRRLALLALTLFAIDDAHVYPIAWLANRSVLVSMTFGLLGLWAHLRWRRLGWRPGPAVSVLALAAALLGGEYGVAVAAYVVAYEVLGRRGPWRGRALALLGPALVVAAYVVLHRVLHYGAAASDVYLDPIGRPLAFAAGLAARAPMLAADILLVIPTDRMNLYEATARWGPWLSMVAVALVLGFLPGALRHQRSATTRHVYWLLGGAALSLLPVSASFLSGRLTAVGSLGGHVAVAALILDGHRRLLAWRTTRQPAPVRTTIAAVLLVAHAVLAPVWGVLDLRVLRAYNEAGRKAALRMPVPDESVREQRWIALTAIDPMTLIYPPWIRRAQGKPLPQSWWVLSMAPYPHTMTRVSARALELEVVGGAMLETPVERLFRGHDNRLQAGDTIELDGLTVRIDAVDELGSPTRVRYAFDRPLDDPSLQFFVVSPKGFLRYPIGPVGSTVSIGAGVHPLGMD